jgi:hypothetical protein
MQINFQHIEQREQRRVGAAVSGVTLQPTLRPPPLQPRCQNEDFEAVLQVLLYCVGGGAVLLQTTVDGSAPSPTHKAATQSMQGKAERKANTTTQTNTKQERKQRQCKTSTQAKLCRTVL